MTDTEKAGRGFLARWSRRKLRARAESVEIEDRASLPGEVGLDLLPEADPRTQEPEASGDVPALLTDADMPALETLGPDSDYSAFLSRGVSQTLRRQALRRLFRSPHLNRVDGLDDFAEDFTGLAPLGDIVTADMRFRLEQAARVAAAGLQADPDVAVSDSGSRAGEAPPDLLSTAAERTSDDDSRPASRIPRALQVSALPGGESDRPDTDCEDAES